MGMARQSLNRSEIIPFVQEGSGKGMTDHMGMDSFFGSGSFARNLTTPGLVNDLGFLGPLDDNGLTFYFEDDTPINHLHDFSNPAFLSTKGLFRPFEKAMGIT